METSYWLERAGETLPDATPLEIERAAFILAMQYTASDVHFDRDGATLPTWQYAPGKVTPSTEALPFDEIKPQTIAAPYVTLSPRGLHGGLMVDARAFDGVQGGGVPDMTSAPDATEAFKSIMGVQSGNVVVKRRGTARVQGDVVCTSCDDLPNGASPGLLSTMLRDLPRNSIGAVGWQVSILTDLFYGDVIPGQLGHDTLQSGEHIPHDVDLSTVRGIVGKEAAASGAGHMSWPMRTRLPRVVLRKSEQVYVRPGALIAPHSDPRRMWVGHKCWTRGKLARATRGGKRAARTVTFGTAVVIDTPSALAELCDNVNRGERVTLRYNGVPLTLTRGKGTAGTFAITTPRGKASGLRTPQNVAKRASELVA